MVETYSSKVLVPETWMVAVETYSSMVVDTSLVEVETCRHKVVSKEMVLVQACSISWKEFWEHMQMAWQIEQHHFHSWILL